MRGGRRPHEAAKQIEDVMFSIRLAIPGEIAALNALIERSARGLSAGYYSAQEIDSAVRYVFGVDSNLVADETYLVVLEGEEIVGCGGWSRRRTLYGGDQRPVGSDEFLDPHVDPAKIRAFFVAPEHARRGIGRLLLEACVAAAREAGFRRFELMATLPGVPLYEACGFRRVRDVVDVLPDGTSLRFVQMERS
jgi:GNAT superfamily N-acetyltransferase